MSVQVKICGLNDRVSVLATSEGGAKYAGFVFYPKSPRAVSAEVASALSALLSPSVMPVGLFVDPSDDELMRVLRLAPLRALQLHGDETPQRVSEIKKQTGLMIIKAVGIASAQDLILARAYEDVADLLLLDAKPAPDAVLPGGNAQRFDWTIVNGARFAKPWMLAGGLTPETLAQAVAATGARLVDVSSGVEEAPGHKNPVKIKAFLESAQGIETSY